MKLQLINTYVSNLEFKILEKSEIDVLKDKTFSLDFSVNFGENKNEFAITFSIVIINPEKYNLEANYIAVFQSDVDITDEFKDSHFPSLNAPSIAFPFLRSFVANFCINAGVGGLILPSINFLEYKKKDTTNITH